MEHVYFHVDLDAFFASVEQLDHPEYRNKPVIVGGIPGDRRSVVSTASYEARKYGVHSAMPLEKAIKLCPNAIFLRPNFHRYQEKSLQIMELFNSFSPSVIQISIDEAFLDMTGTQKLFGKPEEVAQRLKKEVKEETGLTVSVGVASTMYIAKIASGLSKPNGLTVIPNGQEEDFMLKLPITKLWGIGTKTQEHLKQAGFYTTQNIYNYSLSGLKTIFGNATGTFLYNAVRGNKELLFGENPKSRSISSETTFDFDLTALYAMESAIMELSYNVLFRMHKEQVHSCTVSIKIRYSDFTTVSAQSTESRLVSSVDDMFNRCCKLFEKKYEKGRGIRLLGVSCENLEDKDTHIQAELFDFGEEKKAKVEKAIFELEKKHPEIKIKKARLLESTQKRF